MTKKLLIIILVIAVAVAMAVTLSQGEQYEAFMKTAYKTSGRIDRKEERIADPKTKRTEYWLHYTFTDRNGQTYYKQDRVEFPDLWLGFRESYPVDVYYNLARPAESYPAALVARRMGQAGAARQ
jgi:hypothetical protein